MQFEYDPERLIEEIKNRPAIWDFDDVNYRAKDVKHKQWNEVIKELMQSNVIVTKSDMRELELQLQKKWKSLRDCFQKYVQNPNRQKRPYIYAKHLQFLLKNRSMPGPNNGSSGSEDDEKDKSVNKWKTKRKLKLVKHEEQFSDDDNLNFHEEYVSYSNDAADVEIPAKIHKNSKTVGEFAFASVDSNKTDFEDADKMFLLSLLPHLKSIPEEFRLNAKMDLMQVLRNANYNTLTDKVG